MLKGTWFFHLISTLMWGWACPNPPLIFSFDLNGFFFHYSITSPAHVKTLWNQLSGPLLIKSFSYVTNEPEKRCHGLGDLNATNKQNKQGVCHTVALPFYIKKCLKAKEELWKLKYFTMQKSKRNQNPSTYYNSIITNLKFQHKPKYHRSKILI
jgi:hypothetical protein